MFTGIKCFHECLLPQICQLGVKVKNNITVYLGDRGVVGRVVGSGLQTPELVVRFRKVMLPLLPALLNCGLDPYPVTVLTTIFT